MKIIVLILIMLANITLLFATNLTVPASRINLMALVVIDLLLGFLLGSMEFDQ